jgi:hypothetical protein
LAAAFHLNFVVPFLRDFWQDYFTVFVALDHHVCNQRLNPLVVAEWTSNPVDQVLGHRHVTCHRLLGNGRAPEFIWIHHYARLRRHLFRFVLFLLIRLRSLPAITSVVVRTRPYTRVTRTSTTPTPRYLPAGNTVSSCGARRRRRLLLALLWRAFQSVVVKIIEK